MVDKKMKLSFCTTCMNRVEYLKETLPQNIKLISKYNYELTLVNYDSKDDLHDYIINNYKEYIDNNTINYIKIENKNFFNRFHAKNIAHRYSTGDILINLDADNFINEKLISIIIDYFTKDINYVLQCDYNEGFIVISRDNFFKLGGYNEEMKNYGFEDTDLVFRAFYLLNLPFIYLEKGLVDFIKQPDEIRFSNMENEVKTKLSEYNINIHKHYMDLKISNPNLYNNIEWGKI
jgi:predicted glycosyltransferase involved in capsule biosynthesis